MNIQERDILNILLSQPYVNQRSLSEESGHSLGVVNRSIRNLKEEGYLDDQAEPTEKAKRESREKAPRNAVILADGFGVREMPDSAETPRGLLMVRGEPLIERTIRQLHSAGLKEIYIVAGFHKERYEYLTDVYDVELIINTVYTSGGTLRSLSLALPHLSNTYIIPCDVWCGSNPYRRYELYSWYMVNEQVDRKSTVRVNRKKELILTSCQAGGGAAGNGVVGIAYLLEEQAAVLKGRIAGIRGGTRSKENEQFAGFAWGEWPDGYGGQRGSGQPWEMVLYEKDRLILPARVLRGADALRIHTMEQLRRLEAAPDPPRSEALTACRVFLGAPPEGFVEATAPGRGAADRSFLFSGKGNRYMVRIPAEGTKQTIDCGHAEKAYASISGKGICGDTVTVGLGGGYRIMELLGEVRPCDPASISDLEKCMTFLRRFHEMGLRVEHRFDLFDRIDFYESLWDRRPSLYKDYEMTKENVLSLRPYIEKHVAQVSLTNIDAAPENFLIYDGETDMYSSGRFIGEDSAEENGEVLFNRGNRQEVTDRSGQKYISLERGYELQMIGWEHAGMQDPHVDLAMFCIAALYNRRQADRLMDIYFNGICPDETRIKIYCYIAVCGLLRSNWCEYRMGQGVEFGEYSLRQYRYAKEYCRIAGEEIQKKNVQPCKDVHKIKK